MRDCRECISHKRHLATKEGRLASDGPRVLQASSVVVAAREPAAQRARATARVVHRTCRLQESRLVKDHMQIYQKS